MLQNVFEENLILRYFSFVNIVGNLFRLRFELKYVTRFVYNLYSSKLFIFKQHLLIDNNVKNKF